MWAKSQTDCLAIRLGAEVLQPALKGLRGGRLSRLVRKDICRALCKCAGGPEACPLILQGAGPYLFRASYATGGRSLAKCIAPFGPRAFLLPVRSSQSLILRLYIRDCFTACPRCGFISRSSECVGRKPLAQVTSDETRACRSNGVLFWWRGYSC